MRLDDLGLVSPVWQGTRLPNVRRVYLTEDDDARAHQPPPAMRTPGGVYLWPNGWVTLYTAEDGNQNEGVIYPPEAIDHMEFGS
jgi:hypothetical protein